MTKRVSLSEYIEQIGEEAFAKRFGVTIRATRSYRYGERKPRFELVRALLKETPVNFTKDS